MVGVKVGRGVSVRIGVPVGGVVVGCRVLITNKSGVFEAGNPNGVAVGPGVFTGVDVCRNGSEIGKPEQPERREIITIIIIDLLISPLVHKILQLLQKAGAYAFRFASSYIRLIAAARSRHCLIREFAARIKSTAPNAAASPVRG
jgi:hypothetical protein